MRATRLLARADVVLYPGTYLDPAVADDVRDQLLRDADAAFRQRLALHPQHALALELSTEKPKRGRPARAEVVGSAT